MTKKKKKLHPAPERHQKIELPDWDDSCLMCGVADELETCIQCGKPLCDECKSKANRCGLCESYNLPDNFTVLPDTATGVRALVGIYLNSHELKDIPKPHVFWYDDPKMQRVVTVRCRVWAGIGVHYHTDIEDDEDPIWCSEENAWVNVRNHHEARPRWSEMTCKPKTAEAAAAWVRRKLIQHYKKKSTYVVFRESEIRKWFYREGD